MLGCSVNPPQIGELTVMRVVKKKRVCNCQVRSRKVMYEGQASLVEGLGVGLLKSLWRGVVRPRAKATFFFRVIP